MLNCFKIIIIRNEIIIENIMCYFIYIYLSVSVGKRFFIHTCNIRRVQCACLRATEWRVYERKEYIKVVERVSIDNRVRESTR